jgi:ribosome-associated translation inhibitor RaiA
MDRSEALESVIRDRAAELAKLFDRITNCRVTVEAPSQHHRQGQPFRVQIDVSVPGKDIVANRQTGQNDAHEDPHLAVREAFQAAGRELTKYADRKRGQVKRHSQSS